MVLCPHSCVEENFAMLLMAKPSYIMQLVLTIFYYMRKFNPSFEYTKLKPYQTELHKILKRIIKFEGVIRSQKDQIKER